ncbi:MAG: hypothetical protein ACI4C1_01265 [Lachnospiraceae bacterium]
MSWSPIQRMELIRYAEQILHLPGNQSGQILEMAIVFDRNVSQEKLQDAVNFLVPALKQHSDTFRNVRLNLIQWGSDDCIDLQVTSMGFLLMGNCFPKLQEIRSDKTMEQLAAYLKLYTARCRLILILTDGQINVGNREQLESHMKPFLFRKMIWMLEDQSKKEWIESLMPCPPYRIMMPVS